jgi:hypothetical protein
MLHIILGNLRAVLQASASISQQQQMVGAHQLLQDEGMVIAGPQGMMEGSQSFLQDYEQLSDLVGIGRGQGQDLCVLHLAVLQRLALEQKCNARLQALGLNYLLWHWLQHLGEQQCGDAEQRQAGGSLISVPEKAMTLLDAAQSVLQAVEAPGVDDHDEPMQSSLRQQGTETSPPPLEAGADIAAVQAGPFEQDALSSLAQHVTEQQQQQQQPMLLGDAEPHGYGPDDLDLVLPHQHEEELEMHPAEPPVHQADGDMGWQGPQGLLEQAQQQQQQGEWQGQEQEQPQTAAGSWRELLEYSLPDHSQSFAQLKSHLDVFSRACWEVNAHGWARMLRSVTLLQPPGGDPVVTDASIRQLALSVPGLQDLSVQAAQLLTDDALLALSRASMLHKLTLSEATQVTPAGLAALVRLPVDGHHTAAANTASSPAGQGADDATSAGDSSNTGQHSMQGVEITPHAEADGQLHGHTTASSRTHDQQAPCFPTPTQHQGKAAGVVSPLQMVRLVACSGITQADCMAIMRAAVQHGHGSLEIECMRRPRRLQT